MFSFSFLYALSARKARKKRRCPSRDTAEGNSPWLMKLKYYSRGVHLKNKPFGPVRTGAETRFSSMAYSRETRFTGRTRAARIEPFIFSYPVLDTLLLAPQRFFSAEAAGHCFLAHFPAETPLVGCRLQRRAGRLADRFYAFSG